MLVRPRATVADLRGDIGRYDGVWLGLLVVLGGHLDEILRGLASVWAVRNLGGTLMLLASVGQALLAVVFSLLACELVLGKGRSHARGACLVALAVVVPTAHLLGVLGIAVVRPDYAIPVAGGLLSVALAGWVRSAVPSQEGTG
jgi:hypothetical protein